MARIIDDPARESTTFFENMRYRLSIIQSTHEQLPSAAFLPSYEKDMPPASHYSNRHPMAGKEKPTANPFYGMTAGHIRFEILRDRHAQGYPFTPPIMMPLTK
jgi:hypothetical protein